jgi:hypothetical protein
MRAVIVTGDRNAEWDTWRHTVYRAIYAQKKYGYGPVVIHGGANGIDSLSEPAMEGCDVSFVRMPAQWDAHGNSAGPMRNRAMLNVLLILKEHGYDVSVLAFHNTITASKGTKGMVNLALERNVPVTLYGSNGNKELVTERVP